MSAKLIDKNGNPDPLTYLEFIAAQSAVVKIREKRVKEQAKTDAKIAEMRAREAIKTEREERRAAVKAQATENWKKHQQMQREEKKEVEREAAKIREREQKQREKLRVKTTAKTTTEKAHLQVERDTRKAGDLKNAREARAREKAFRDAERDAEKKLADEVNRNNKTKVYRDNSDMIDKAEDWMKPILGLLLFDLLGAITERCDLDHSPSVLNRFGMALIDDGMALALIINHQPTIDELELPTDYHFALYEHPQMIDQSRAVWFGDRLERCIVFSLPFESSAPK